MTISKSPSLKTRIGSHLSASTGLVFSLMMISICSSQLVEADTIELLNEDKLTGTLTAMGNDGAVIASPNYVSPLLVKKTSIKQIDFTNDLETPQPHTELLTLINGDSLPCKVLSMEDDFLKISTWYAGDFSIARENIFSLRFGLSEEQNIYSGEDKITEWATYEGWLPITEGSYTSSKPAVLARELPLPENIHINFDLAWAGTPNFVFRFCAESTATTRQGSYEFVFNSAGIQIRHHEGKTKSAPMVNIDLNPAEIESKQMNIDLKVDRSEGSITLYLDGLKTGSYHGIFDPPAGKHIIFENRASVGNTCSVKGLRITDWKDASPTRHLSKVSPSKMDVIIESLGDQRSGKVTDIRKGKNNERIIQFADKHSSEPLMIPDRYISLLYFAEAEHDPSHPELAFTANLTGYGSLQLEDTELSESKITTRHPILGEYSLDRRILANITQNKELLNK